MVGEHQAGSNLVNDQPTEKMRVLVVDDHPDIVRTYAFMLRRAGFEVETASNGRDALNRAVEFHPRVALLDIGLPDVDGYEIARRLRADGSLPITLIAITAYGTDENCRLANAVGFDHFLVKPVLFDNLLSLLQSAS